MCGGVGVCVNMMHVFGDKLWSLEESLCVQIPLLGALQRAPNVQTDFPVLGGDARPAAAAAAVQVPTLPKYQAPVEHFPMLGGEPKRKPIAQPVQTLVPSVQKLSVQNEAISADDSSSNESDNDEPLAASNSPTGEGEPSPTADAADSEDEILRRAFLTTLKLEGRKLPLPLLTSTFYRCHVVPAAERPIDLKKTTYKKLGKFLAEMADERYISLREEQKGIEKIVTVNVDHPELVEFVAQAKKPAGGTNVDEANGSNLFRTEMKECKYIGYQFELVSP